MANQIQNKQAGRYQPYPEYKDSNSRWYLKIPKSWERVALKYITANFVKDGPHETPKFINSGIPFLSVDSIQNNQLTFKNCRYISLEDHARYSVKCRPSVGDILLGKAASIGKVALVTTSIDFNVWSPLAVITPKNNKLSKYIFYSLQSTNLQTQCDLFSNSNTQKNLGMNTIDNLHFLKPSDEEAQKIAQFLDYETAKIDLLIEKQQKLIELLKEKRQAVISHAVTKGLDPNVEMKDSGVEWLGEVPAHWEVKPLRWLLKIKSGEGLSINNIEKDCSIFNKYPVIGGNGVLGYCRNYNVNFEVIAIGRVGALCGNVHRITKPSWITDNALMIYTWMVFISEFLVYLFITLNLNQYSSKTAQPLITGEIIKNIRIAVPNKKEQTQIAEYLDTQTSKIDLLIEKAEAQITLMQERRTALISAAVTGKIDLRHWQMPEVSDHQGGDYE